MDPLEQELRRALTRKQPSTGFADRVSTAARRPRRFRLPRWAPAAAAMLVMAGGGYGYRWRQGVAAKHEVMTAMRIAAQKLNRIQVQVQEVER